MYLENTQYSKEPIIRNTCIVNGQEYKYDLAHISKDCSFANERYKYLGVGIIHTVRGNVDTSTNKQPVHLWFEKELGQDTIYKDFKTFKKLN